jgi:hypothetical protein
MKESYVKQLNDIIKLDPLDHNKSSNIKQDIKCLICNSIFSATPKSKIQNFKKNNSIGCPACTSIKRYDGVRTDSIEFLKQRFDIINLKNTLFTNNDKILVKNKECGHEFTAKMGNLLNRNVVCPVCNTERKRNLYHQYNEERAQEALINKAPFQQYKQIVYRMTRHTYKKYKSIINPNNLQRTLAGNPGYHLDHIVSLKYAFSLKIPPEITSHYENLRMIPWEDNLKKNSRPVRVEKIPAIFYPYMKSPEICKNFISSVNSHILDFDVNVLMEKYVLTLFNKETNFGVCFLTLEENKQSLLVSKKTSLKMLDHFNKLGIKVLLVFEDEWIQNSQIVLDKIKHIMGASSATTIYARKCEIKEISKDDKNSFLNKFHIQGTCVSQYNYGAYYDGVLVAAMTFSKPRILMNKYSKQGEIELARFTTHADYRVVGVASKLLKHAKNTMEGFDCIYSFADRRWSDGNVYTQLGFSLDRINPPEYYYIVDNTRKHRWGFRRDALKERKGFNFDSSKTEYENMLANGFDRVWDCGTLRYVLKY